MIKTLCYDHLSLYGPTKWSVNEVPTLPTTMPTLHVTLLKEDLKRFGDQYKILVEFVAQALGKRSFDQIDILTYYRKKELEFEKGKGVQP